MNLGFFHILRPARFQYLTDTADAVDNYVAEVNQWEAKHLAQFQRAEEATASLEAETHRADEAEASVEEQGRQLAELRRQLNEANDEREGMRSVLAQSDGQLRQAREELAAQRAEFNALADEVRAIKAAAEDPAGGQTVRAAIAFGFLHSIVQEARAQGRDLGRFDLVAAILFGRDGEQTVVDEKPAYVEGQEQEEVRP